MSTSLLYHAWGLRGYRHVRTDYVGGTVRFAVEQDPATFACAACGSCHVVRAGVVPRSFRTLPVGGKAVFVDLPVQRLWCAACGTTRQAAVAFVDPRRTYTRAFERYVLELSGHTTIKGVARHPGVGWGVVKDIRKRSPGRRFARPKLKRLKHIAIAPGRRS